MTFHKITLSDDYATLRRQAGALITHNHALEQINSTLSKIAAESSEEALANLRAQIQSERNANAILTDEVDRLRAQVKLLSTF